MKKIYILVPASVLLSFFIAYFSYSLGYKKAYQLFYGSYLQSEAINARSTLDEALIINSTFEDNKINCFTGRLIKKALGKIDACRSDSICSEYIIENDNKQKFSTLYNVAEKIEFDANICNKGVMTYTRSLTNKK